MADPRAQAAGRRCEQCGGAMPGRMHRQRSNGKLVCDNCHRWPNKSAAFRYTDGSSTEWRVSRGTGGPIYRIANGDHEATVWEEDRAPRLYEWEVHRLSDLSGVTGGRAPSLEEAMDEVEQHLPGFQQAASRVVVAALEWKTKYNSYREPYYELERADRRATIWEVASRPGRYQWHVVSLPEFYSIASGDEYMSDSLDEAKRSAEQYFPDKTSHRIAHDSGDNALLNHCPFCGSGAITGGSDGSVDCDYCHTVFTVQVQPAHPNMPQTIDGQPMPPPGMPAGEETEMSAPVDPAVDEDASGAPSDAFGDAEADPTEMAGRHDPNADQSVDKGENPFAKKKKPNPFEKKSGGLQKEEGWVGLTTNDGDALNWYLREGALHASVREVHPGVFGWIVGNAITFEPIGEGSGTSLDEAKAEAEQMLAAKARADAIVMPKAASGPPEFREGARFFTTEGETLSMGSYIDRLALDFADDRMAVLGAVRASHEQ